MVQTFNDALFDVKGTVHPSDKVIAYVRFVPDSEGDRRLGKLLYRKVYPLSERYDLLERLLPQYLVYDPVFDERVCAVPKKDVKCHFVPNRRLERLRRKKNPDNLEECTLRFIECLKREANILWGSTGVSGSVLVGLHTYASDIDPIFYGSGNCRKVYDVLGTLVREEMVQAYDLNGLKILFELRVKDTVVSFSDFFRTESRKVMQGRFMGRDYFVRFVKDWNEVDERYGDVRYRNEGYAKVRARVIDDTEAIFTPCNYRVDKVEVLEGPRNNAIREVSSFRGRFCEQARRGEAIVAQGKVERVERSGTPSYHRLLVGGNAADYIVLA